jgi:hypothetical protein
MTLAFSFTLRVARISAAPPTAVVRLPYVPQPIGETSVSPCITLTSFTSTPISLATSCAKVVSSPWPCGEAPMNAWTFPVGWTRTIALSQSPPWKPIAPAT